MLEIEEFEIKPEPKLRAITQAVIANIKFWIWAAVNSARFSDIYFGLNQSPIETFTINNHRFFEISFAFHKRLWLTYCVPFSIIDDYRDATGNSTDLLFR